MISRKLTHIKPINSREIPQLIDDGGNCITLNLGHIERWVRENVDEFELQLNPDFQRGHVWSKSQQTAYLEYILTGGKDNKTIRFNHPAWTTAYEGDYQDFVIVDGLQRLTAVREFLANKIPGYKQYYLNDFSDRVRLLRVKYLNFSINSLKSKKEVLKWYLQINKLGTPHSQEEISKVEMLLERSQYD